MTVVFFRTVPRNTELEMNNRKRYCYTVLCSVLRFLPHSPGEGTTGSLPPPNHKVLLLKRHLRRKLCLMSMDAFVGRQKR